MDGDAGSRFSFDDDPAMFKLFNDSALYGDGSTCSCGRTLFTAAYVCMLVYVRVRLCVRFFFLNGQALLFLR